MKHKLLNVIKYLFPNIRNIVSNNDIHIGKFTNIKGSILEGKNAIGNFSVITNCIIGKGTYLGNKVIITDSTIGRFCSIGQNMQVIAAQHPIKEFISTSPLFYTTRNKCKSYVDYEKFPNFKYVYGTKNKVVIGNDVWIGNNTIIMGGITIGDGAVIATGAIVTKDVEPYSIVGGVPAKHISSRFEKEKIDILLSNPWWNKSEEWLVKNAENFSRIDKFIDNLKNE